MNQPKSPLQALYSLLSIAPVLDSEAEKMIGQWEKKTEHRLPAVVREFYSLKGSRRLWRKYMLDNHLESLPALLVGYKNAYDGQIPAVLKERDIAPPSGSRSLVFLNADVMEIIHTFLELDDSDDPLVREHFRIRNRGWLRESRTFSSFMIEIFKDFSKARRSAVSPKSSTAVRPPKIRPAPISIHSSPPSESGGVTLEEAMRIFGKDFIGPKQVSSVLGELGTIPAIPFHREELMNARELNQQLILHVDKIKDEPLTMQSLNKVRHGRGLNGNLLLNHNNADGTLGPSAHWFEENPFFTRDVPRRGWALVTRTVVDGSFKKDYLGQTQALADYAKGRMFLNRAMPAAVQEAIEEFNLRLPAIRKLFDVRIYADLEPSKALERLKISRWFRESPVEVLYRFLFTKMAANHQLITQKRWEGNGGYFFISLLPDYRNGILIRQENVRGTNRVMGASFIWREPLH